MKKRVIILLVLLLTIGNTISFAQISSAIVHPITCSGVCDGSITITVDPSQLESYQELPFEVEYISGDSGNSGSFIMNDYSIFLPNLCMGEYEIVVTLNDDEVNGVCIDEFILQVTLEEYIPDFITSFSLGSDPTIRNAFLELNNPIPGEDIMFQLFRDMTGEILCESQLNEMFNSRFCPNLNSTEEYCAIFTRANGCKAFKCFKVPGQSCLNELNISLVSSTDECKDFADGSLEVSVELNECTEYNIAWTSGDIGLLADDLKAGNYCVTAISKDCENCRTVACFDVGSAPEGCDDNTPCNDVIRNEILNKKITINAESIFYNNISGDCENGSVTFDASGSDFDITVSLIPPFLDECILDSDDLDLTQTNPEGSFQIKCNTPTQGKECTGTYCFKISKADDANCFVTICRNIKFCEGRSRNSKGISCSISGDGGTGGNDIGKENIIVRPPSTGSNLPEIDLKKIDPLKDNTMLTLAKIYPNPFTTDINIQLESIDEQTIQVELTDIYGRTVIREIQELTKGVNLIKLQPSNNLASGIYALTIIDQDQKKYTQLITRMNN